MRRHKGWLKWSLALVVLTFIVFYIPDFVGPTSRWRGRATGWRASIRGRFRWPISAAATWLRCRPTARPTAAKLTDEILQQMQVPQQVLQQMIQEKAELTEAERAVSRVSDAEVRAQIMAIPGLQENGQFIGEAALPPAAGAAEPPMTPADFERSVREGLHARQVPRRPHRMDDGVGADLEREYKRRNEKVTLDVVAVLADNFKTQVNADRRGHFCALRQEQGKLPHPRSAQDQVRARQSRRDRGDAQGVEAKTSSGITTRSSASTPRPNRFARATSC